jgi:hypothetical protein
MTLLSLFFPRHGLLLSFCFSVLPLLYIWLLLVLIFSFFIFFFFFFCSWMSSGIRATELRDYARSRDGMRGDWNVYLDGREGRSFS